MSTLQEKFESTSDFLIGAELVSTRGLRTETRAAKTMSFARDLEGCASADWVSITDNAGGNPMLAPIALSRPLLAAGRNVVIHLSCKDFNRNALESQAWLLGSEGLDNVLVLSGDYAGTGVGGGAKPAFDIDSIGLLQLLARMNAGLDISKTPGSGKPARLQPTKFFPGAVVNNFKFSENEVIPQLLKLERKIALGARFIIPQIGYDSRKSHELIAWMKERGHANVPLVGNTFVLTGPAARVFAARRIPGVIISDELAAL